MTFVRAKLMLEKMAPGEVLDIRLNEGEPGHNVPSALRDHGHELIEMVPAGAGRLRLRVRKRR